MTRASSGNINPIAIEYGVHFTYFSYYDGLFGFYTGTKGKPNKAEKNSGLADLFSRTLNPILFNRGGQITTATAPPISLSSGILPVSGPSGGLAGSTSEYLRISPWPGSVGMFLSFLSSVI